MTGARRGRLAALLASAVLGGTVLLVGGGPSAGQEAQPCPTNTTILDQCNTTSSETTLLETTTTFQETTTTFIQTTTTFQQTITTQAPVQETTSTSLEVTTSQNLLVPGDGTEGAESTTTTEALLTVSDGDTSDAALLALIVGGLLLLAVAVSILAWRYWAATRPPLPAAVGSDRG